MSAPLENTPAGAVLPRRFGFWTGSFVVVASMVGVGILTTSGYTIQATESHPTLLLLWAAGGCLALCGSLTIAELATSMPRVGGDYVYIRESYGSACSFVYGWSTLLVGFAAPIALYAHASVTYLTIPFAPRLSRLPAGMFPDILVPLGASLLIAILAVSHCRGQRDSAWVQAGTTTIKLAALVGLALFGLLLGEGDWSHLTTGRPIGVQEAVVLAPTLVYVMYSYTGWNAAIYLAGEIHDPPRMLPRCLIGGCLAVTLLYLLMNLTYAYALPPAALAGMEGAEVEPVAEIAARRLFGSQISGVLSFLIGLGLLGSLSANVLTAPRVVYAMAHDGLFPRYAGRLPTGKEVPVAATLTMAAASIGLLWSGTFHTLLNYTSTGLVLLAGAVVSCIFVLRRRSDLSRPFRVPLYPLPPLAFLAITAWMIVFACRTNPLPLCFSLLSMLAGFPVYWLVFRKT